MGGSCIPPPSGEGDRGAVEGANPIRQRPGLAPFTMLRMVPLPQWGRITA